jgi:hypothetical protein
MLQMLYKTEQFLFCSFFCYFFEGSPPTAKNQVFPAFGSKIGVSVPLTLYFSNTLARFTAHHSSACLSVNRLLLQQTTRRSKKEGSIAIREDDFGHHGLLLITWGISRELLRKDPNRDLR